MKKDHIDMLFFNIIDSRVVCFLREFLRLSFAHALCCCLGTLTSFSRHGILIEITVEWRD